MSKEDELSKKREQEKKNRSVELKRIQLERERLKRFNEQAIKGKPKGNRPDRDD